MPIFCQNCGDEYTSCECQGHTLTGPTPPKVPHAEAIHNPPKHVKRPPKVVRKKERSA